MSIPFFQAQDVGSRLAAIPRTDSGSETRSWPILSHVRLFGFGKPGSIELWAWSWNCHVLLWIQWAKTPGTGMEELGMGTSLSARIHETRIGTLFSFWQWLRQCLVNLKNWAWTMNKVLSHSSEIVTLLSVLEEIYVAACGSFCVSAVPSEILKLVWIHPRNVLVLGTSPILLHPNMYQLRYIMIYIIYGVFHAWATAGLLRMNCWISIPNYPKLLT